MPDDQWLEDVGKRGWFVFSHDRNFHTNAAAMSAIKQHTIGCFYVWGAEATTWEKLRSFARASTKITEAAAKTPRPFIFHLTKVGSLASVKIP